MENRFPLSSEPPLTEQEVYYAFRFAFGREPRQVDIDWHRRHASFEAMRRLFVESPEFRLERGMMPAPAGRRVAVEMDNGACIWVLLDDRFVTSGIVAGDWEPLETRFIASRLSPGSIFLDVGAFLGWFTMTAAPIVGPAGAVLAFEPQSEAHALLRRGVLANRFEPWVSTFDVALSNEAGEVALWRDELPEGQRTGNLGHTWIGDAGHPAARPAGRARSLRLDDLGLSRRVDLVKLDVEGAEWLVLEGGERTIRESHPVIVCEFYPAQLRHVSGIDGQALLDRLATWGYQPHMIAADLALRPFTPADMPEGEGAYVTLVFA